MGSLSVSSQITNTVNATAAINASLTKTQVALDIEMKDAEELTG